MKYSYHVLFPFMKNLFHNCYLVGFAGGGTTKQRGTRGGTTSVSNTYYI